MRKRLFANAETPLNKHRRGPHTNVRASSSPHTNYGNKLFYLLQERIARIPAISSSS